MARIIEKIIEPSKVYVGSSFMLKIKVQDSLLNKAQFITEDGLKLITEDNKNIITEWGE